MRIVVAGAVLAWLAVLSLCDLRQRRLPNALTLPGAGAIMLGAAVGGHGVSALGGGAALSAVYLLVHVLWPTAMGAGDVKLAIGLGALTGCFGVEVWLLAALSAALLTAMCGIVAKVARGTSTVPHGPSMCVASAAAVGLAVF